MKYCPSCGATSKVTDSRMSGPDAIRRRRRCSRKKCKEKWTTFEVGVDEYRHLNALKEAETAMKAAMTAVRRSAIDLHKRNRA